MAMDELASPEEGLSHVLAMQCPPVPPASSAIPVAQNTPSVPKENDHRITTLPRIASRNALSIPLTVSPPFFGVCISELQRSHAEMSSKMEVISERLDSMDCRWAEERVRNENAKAAEAVQRCLTFARARAIAILRSGGPEIRQKPSNLCAANSIVPIRLRSPPSDCTLREFCLILSHIRQKSGIRCCVSPSEYYASHPSTSHTTSMEIRFHSYRDICETLCIDAHEMEFGIYKEVCDNSRALRAVQILGTHIASETDRRIILGRGFEEGVAQFPFFHQRRPVWREGAWETGFTIQFESAPLHATENASFPAHCSNSSTSGNNANPRKSYFSSGPGFRHRPRIHSWASSIALRSSCCANAPSYSYCANDFSDALRRALPTANYHSKTRKIEIGLESTE